MSRSRQRRRRRRRRPVTFATPSRRHRLLRRRRKRVAAIPLVSVRFWPPLSPVLPPLPARPPPTTSRLQIPEVFETAFARWLEATHESPERPRQEPEAIEERGRPAGDRGRTGWSSAAGKGAADEEGQELGGVLGSARRRRRRRRKRVGFGRRRHQKTELRRQVHQQDEVSRDGRQEDSRRRLKTAIAIITVQNTCTILYIYIYIV